MTTKTTVSRLEILDAVRDSIQLHSLRAIDDKMFGKSNEAELREVDRLWRTYRALQAGAEVESE